jgi:hypothetical protein
VHVQLRLRHVVVLGLARHLRVSRDRDQIFLPARGGVRGQSDRPVQGLPGLASDLAGHREGGGGDGRVQQCKQALLATAGSLPPRLSDASSHSVLQQFVKKTATSITGSTLPPAAPGMHPGRTYACRSAPVPAASPPHLLMKPRVYLCMKLPPAHVEPTLHRAEVPIPVALASRSEHPDRLPAREASSAHGHVSGGKWQGLEARWLYEEGPMWWLRATSRPAPHPGLEDLVLTQHQLDPVDQLRRG